MKHLKYLALALLLCTGSKAFAQGLGMGYGYPTMPQIHAAGGGGAAASAAPTPSVVTSGTATLTAAQTVTMTGTTAGDVIYCQVCGNLQTPNNATTWNLITNSAFSAGPPYHWLLTHVVIPGDTSPYTIVSGTVTAGSAACVELNHAYPQWDTGADWGAANLNNAANTTVATNNSTSTLANDVGLWLALTQGSGQDISAAPSGYALTHIAATASAQGCAMGFKASVGAAGSIAVGNGTSALNTSGANVTTQLVLVSGFKSSY